MAVPKTFVFVDGENLVMRYQAMLAAGAKPKKDVIHVSDAFVWHPGLTTWSLNGHPTGHVLHERNGGSRANK